MEIEEQYELDFENTKIPVLIYSVQDEFIKTYEVGILETGKYTEVLIEKIKDDLLRGRLFSSSKESVFDYDKLKKLYLSKVRELISEYLPMIGPDTKNKLITYIVQKSLDLGFVDILITDPNLEEITINGGDSKIMVYHKKYGWLKTNLKFLNDDEIRNIASRVAMDNKKVLSQLNPILDAHLRGGHRVNAILSPISTKGSSITIRRFSDSPWTVTNLIKSETSSPMVLAVIWIAMENEMSLIITGGTGSGKTSFLNAISSFIPANQRIVSIEDTREIRLPKYSHWVPMEARQENQEGNGEISMLDLIVNSLRMRPDRIIIGEIRKKREAEVLFEAMRTGHSVYGTFHANSASETILRLSSQPINLPKISLNALDLIVVQHRDRKNGKRFTMHIAEVDVNGNENVILQYNLKTKKYFFKNKPITLLKKLDEFSGINEKEFQELINERIMILNFLKLNDIDKIDGVGRIINEYYLNKEALLSKVRQNLKNLKRINK